MMMGYVIVGGQYVILVICEDLVDGVRMTK